MNDSELKEKLLKEILKPQCEEIIGNMEKKLKQISEDGGLLTQIKNLRLEDGRSLIGVGSIFDKNSDIEINVYNEGDIKNLKSTLLKKINNISINVINNRFILKNHRKLKKTS